MQFCGSQACAWVAQPPSTASCAAYLLAAAWLVRGGPVARCFAAAALAIGVASALFHASNAYVFELLDIASMYSLSCLLVALAFRRVGAVFWALLVASVAVILGSVDAGNGLFGAELAAGIGLELVRLRRRGVTRLPRALGVAGALFAAAYAFWNLDYYGLFCGGHAVWHVLTAGALAALGRHFGSPLTAASPRFNIR